LGTIAETTYQIMKKTLLNILTASAIITTIGYIMDGDAKEPSMMMRFVEFILMIGIVFLLISVVNFTFKFVRINFQKV